MAGGLGGALELSPSLIRLGVAVVFQHVSAESVSLCSAWMVLGCQVTNTCYMSNHAASTLHVEARGPGRFRSNARPLWAGSCGTCAFHQSFVALDSGVGAGVTVPGVIGFLQAGVTGALKVCTVTLQNGSMLCQTE